MSTRLRIFVSTESDVTDSLLSVAEGGRVERGLRDLVQEKYSGAFDLDLVQGEWDRLRFEQVDVAALSIQGPLLGPTPLSQFREHSARLLRNMKEYLDAHMIVFDGYSPDPGDPGAEPDAAFSARVSDFNGALREIATAEGIPILEVDRIIAAIPGQHSIGRLRYSAEAQAAICREFLRVLEEIGCFGNPSPEAAARS